MPNWLRSNETYAFAVGKRSVHPKTCFQRPSLLRLSNSFLFFSPPRNSNQEENTVQSHILQRIISFFIPSWHWKCKTSLTVIASLNNLKGINHFLAPCSYHWLFSTKFISHYHRFCRIISINIFFFQIRRRPTTAERIEKKLKAYSQQQRIHN